MDTTELRTRAREIGLALASAESEEQMVEQFQQLQELLEAYSRSPRQGEDGLERQFRLVRETVNRWPSHMRQFAGFDTN
jgi:hypothetical protein